MGHSTKNCFPLKAKVQSLVKAGWLKFQKTGKEPNVNQNPLPNHENPVINVVVTLVKHYKSDVYKVTTSMRILFQILHEVGYIPLSADDGNVGLKCKN